MHRRLCSQSLRLVSKLQLTDSSAVLAGRSVWLYDKSSYSTRVTPEEFTPIRPPANFGIRFFSILMNWIVWCLDDRVVPEKKAFVVERFGRFLRVLDSGLHFLIPLVPFRAMFVICQVFGVCKGRSDRLCAQFERNCNSDPTSECDHKGQRVDRHRWRPLRQSAGQ